MTEQLMDEMVQRAQQMAPALRRRTGEIEAARRLPDDLAQELMKNGFCRLLAPARYEGLQAHPQVMVEVLKQLAQGDAAVSWCAMIAASTGMVGGWMTEAAAQTVRPGGGCPDGGGGGAARPAGAD